jgi:hypothetical protein
MMAGADPSDIQHQRLLALSRNRTTNQYLSLLRHLGWRLWIMHLATDQASLAGSAGATSATEFGA